MDRQKRNLELHTSRILVKTKAVIEGWRKTECMCGSMVCWLVPLAWDTALMSNLTLQPPIAVLHMAFGSLQFSRSFKQLKKFSSYHPRRNIASNNGFLRISEEVREALHAKRPVVALETTIYTHGWS